MKTATKFIAVLFLMSLMLSFASAEFIVTTTPFQTDNFSDSSSLASDNFVVTTTPLQANDISDSSSLPSMEFVVIKTPLQTNDFSVSSSSAVSSCSCDSTVDYITIDNPYSYSQSFKLSSDNSLISLPSDSVAVAPMSSLPIPYKINTPCDAKSQSFEIIVEGVSKTKSLVKDLTVLQCQNLKVNLFEPQLNVPICEEFLSEFRIENIGSFSEIYEIKLNNYETYASAQFQEVTVPAHSYADIAFNYQFACDMVGDLELSYDITSKKSRISATLIQNVSIANTYDYSVEISSLDETCLADQTTFEIIIKNNNDFADFFRIDIDAPSYVDVAFPEFEGEKTQVIVLDAHSQTTLEAVISPTKERSLGLDEITVIVESKYAQNKQMVTANATVLSCYDFSDIFPSPLQTLSACGDDSFTQQLVVSHLGVKNPVIELVSSNEIVSFENPVMEFVGEETKNATVVFTIPNNLTSKESITISALFNNKTVDETQVSVFVDTKENCYMLSPVKNKVSLLENDDYFALSLQNVGERAGTFSPDLTFAPDYVQLITEDFELSSGRRTNLVFQIDRTLLFQNANEYNNGSIIGLEGLAEFTVENLDSQVIYNDTFAIEFVDYPWYTKAWNVSKTLDPCFVVFFVLSFLVILFGIIGVLKTSRHDHFNSNNVLALILLIIFILATVFIFFQFGVPVSPYTQHDAESNSTTYIVMSEDEELTIDLKSFFFDPDDNLVGFGVGSYDEEVLVVNSQDSFLTLSPRADWFGNTSMTLFVLDSYNESALSPEIIIEVLPVEDYSFFELFSMFCKYVNLIVLFLLFLVIYVAFSFHSQPKEKQLTIKETVESEEKKETKTSSPSKSQKKTPKKKATKKKASTKKKSAKTTKKAPKKKNSKSSKK